MISISRATDDLLYRFAVDAPLSQGGNNGGYTYESMPSQKRHMEKLKKELNEQGMDETHPMHAIIGYKYGPKTFVPNADRTVIARDPNGKIAGALAHDVRRADRELDLRDMRTLPAHKGHGVGEGMVRAMAEHTNELPYSHKYSMRVSGAVPSAVKFYQKMGADFPAEPGYFGSTGLWSLEKTQQLAKGQRPEPGIVHPAFGETSNPLGMEAV
jgi:GNAT superfamily N-acetyltransferase